MLVWRSYLLWQLECHKSQNQLFLRKRMWRIGIYLHIRLLFLWHIKCHKHQIRLFVQKKYIEYRKMWLLSSSDIWWCLGKGIENRKKGIYQVPIVDDMQREIDIKINFLQKKNIENVEKCFYQPPISDDIRNDIDIKTNPSHEKGIGNREKLFLSTSYFWIYQTCYRYQNWTFLERRYRK